MTETAKLIEAFEKEKGEIFELYLAEPKKGETPDDSVALMLAKTYLGVLIDTAIEQLQDTGDITDFLKRSFTLVIRNKPVDEYGLGGNRTATYHERFKNIISPILINVPVAAPDKL